MSQSKTDSETEEQRTENSDDPSFDTDVLEDVFELVVESDVDDPITSGEVSDRVGINDGNGNPKTREVIRTLVEERNVPIAAGPNGYFFLESPDDLQHYLTGLDSRIAGIQERKRTVTEAWNRHTYRRDEDGKARLEFGFDEEDVDDSTDDGFVLLDATIEQVVEDGFDSATEAKGWATRYGFKGDGYEVVAAEEVENE